MSAKEMFEKIKKKEEAWEISIKKFEGWGYNIEIILKYSDSTKIILWSNGNIIIDGNLDLETLPLLHQAIQQQIKELRLGGIEYEHRNEEI